MMFNEVASTLAEVDDALKAIIDTAEQTYHDRERLWTAICEVGVKARTAQRALEAAKTAMTNRTEPLERMRPHKFW